MRNILISAFTAAAVLGVAGTASAQQIQVNFGPNPGYVPPVAEHVQLKPWGVQLSAGFSRERVLAAYAVIATRYATLLADKDTTIVSSVFRSRGTEAFYQVRVGTDTFESANDLCAEIRRAGGACMVLRNRLNQDNMDGSVYANAIHSMTQF
jgi:SPOR domain